MTGANARLAHLVPPGERCTAFVMFQTKRKTALFWQSL